MTAHKYRLAILSFLGLLTASSAHSQFDQWTWRAEAMCAAGASTSSAATRPTFGCGAGINILVLLYTEVGVMAPQANRSYLSGYITNDLQLPLLITKKHHDIIPIGSVGYTRMFETGHALDYGVGLTIPTKKDKDKSLLLELRDYWTFANPSQHNVVFRIGWIVGVRD